MTGGSRRGQSRRARSPPSRGSGSRRWLWTLVVGVVLVTAAVPASSFDTANLDRASTIGVVNDSDALLGINQSQTVSKPADTLVVVTNRFPEQRRISVALETCTSNVLSLATSGTATDGILVSNDGSTVTFDLPAGGSQAVRIEVNDVQCDPIVTRITTTDGLTQVTAERESSPDQSGNGGPPDNGNGNPPAIGKALTLLSTGVLGDG